MLGLTLKRNVLEDEGLLQSLDIEESQRGNEHVVTRPCQPSLLNQEQLKLPNIVGPELIGRAMEVLSELGYTPEVRTNGCSLGVITTLEFLEHHFAKVGHRSSPYDPTLSLHLVYSTAADIRHAQASAAKRLRSNRHVGDAEPGHQRHCWWLKHYLSAPSPGSDQSEPATCILYIEIVPPSHLLSGIPYSQP